MKLYQSILAIIILGTIIVSRASGYNDTIQVESVNTVPGIDYSFSIYGFLDQPHTGFEIPLAFSGYDLVFDSASLLGGIVPSEYEISWRINDDSTHFLLYIFPLVISPPPPNILPPGGKICEVYFSVRDFAPDQLVFIDTAGFPLYVGDSLYQYYTLSGYDTLSMSIDHEYVYGTISIFTDVLDGGSGDYAPEEFHLFQNYPNPFNPTTKITYQLPYEMDVTVEVLNMLGQRIEIIDRGNRQGGYHELYYDASGLKSGFYLYRIRAGDFAQTRKMLLLK